jgi:iron complex outermembrane receptor protein
MNLFLSFLGSPLERPSRKLLVLFFFTFASWAWGQIESAQNPRPAPGSTESDERILVTASRSDAKLQDMPLFTTVLTQKEIQASAASTLDQLLKNVPGLNFTGVPNTQTDPTGQSTKMRGLGNAKVLVLLDGMPVMDPFYLTTQWFKIPLANIERVEIIRGGNSSLWGNMAVAGVINVLSKRVADNTGQIDASMGSRGSSDVAITKNVRVTESLGLNFFVEQLNAKGYAMSPQDQAWRFPQKNTMDAKDSNLQVTAFLNPSEDLKGHLRVGAHVQEQAISYNFGQNTQRSPDVSFSFVKTLDPSSTLTAQLWQQTVDFSKYNGASCYWQSAAVTKCPSASAVTPSQINNTVTQYYTQYGLQNYSEQGASAVYAQRLNNTIKDLQLGLDLRQLKARDQEWFYAAPQSLSSLQNLSSTSTGSGRQSFAGLFAQSHLTPWPELQNLELTVSARMDTYSNTQREIMRTGAGTGGGTGTTGGPQDDTSKTALNPSLAALYTVNDSWSLRAASYQSFRAPGFNNTLRTYGAPNPTIANPDLSPETLFGKELGLDYNAEGLSARATYFVYDIKNMIATSNYQYVGPSNANNSPFIPNLVQSICSGPTLSACAGKASFYSNAQDGQSQGFELAAQWALSAGVKLDASLTRTSSVLTKNQVSTAPLGVQLAGLPWQMAHVALDWQVSSKSRVFVQAHYVGKMLIDTTSALGQVVDQGGVTVLNASLRHQLNKDTALTASVSNLFNRVYSENAYAYNQAWSAILSEPQTVRLGLSTRF